METMSYKSRAHFEEEMQEVTSRHLSEMQKLWSDMGWDSKQLDDRMKTAKKYIEDSYERMVEEERNHMDEILSQIEKLEQERQSLRKELGKKNTLDDDKFDSSVLPFLQILRDLTEEVKGFRQEKEERMVEVKVLYGEDMEATNAVGEDPYYRTVPKKIPTDKEMQEIKEHIRKMKNLKSQRLTQFETQKSEILELYTELECEPNSTFERSMICGLQEEIVLSTKTMNAIEKILATLQAELDANRDVMETMCKRAEVLCTRLDIDKSQYLNPNMVGNSKRHIQEFKVKLDELEELKMAHLSKFIEKSRQELRTLWDKCYYGQVQKQAFLPMTATTYDEEILEEHEKEVERLKNFLDENAAIFRMVYEWQGWWNKRKEIHDRSKDPNRLFNRRGNNLLQEQKEEKEVKRNLPKIEKELRQMVQEYDNLHDVPFALMGIPFDDYLSEIKSELSQEKEIEAMERKESKRRLLEHETMYGVGKALTPIGNLTRTPNKSRRLDGKSRLQTPGSMKRLDKLGTSSSKRPGTVLGSNSKRMRMNENSIISGNLINTNHTVDSTTSYKDHDVISSTFIKESKLYQPGSATKKTPLGSTQMKASTPVRYNLRSPIADNTFKTPSSRARLASSKKEEVRNRTLRSGGPRKVPFKF